MRKSFTDILFFPEIWSSVTEIAPSAVANARYVFPSERMVPGAADSIEFCASIESAYAVVFIESDVYNVALEDADIVAV